MSPRPAAERPLARQDRLIEIADLVLELGAIPLDRLAERFGVSTMTIYRDIAELEEGGVLVRSRGMVTARATSLNETTVAFRLARNTDVKQALSARAAQLVRSGQTIMVDDSSTVQGIVAEVAPKAPLTLITNAQVVAREAGGKQGVRLFVVGGRYRSTLDSFYGSSTIAVLGTLCADLCFLSITGIENGRLYHPYEENIEVKRAMMRSAARSVLVVDSSKFGHRSTHLLGGVEDFDVVVVDDGIPEAELAVLREADVQLELVPRP